MVDARELQASLRSMGIMFSEGDVNVMLKALGAKPRPGTGMALQKDLFRGLKRKMDECGEPPASTTSIVRSPSRSAVTVVRDSVVTVAPLAIVTASLSRVRVSDVGLCKAAEEADAGGGRQRRRGGAEGRAGDSGHERRWCVRGLSVRVCVVCVCVSVCVRVCGDTRRVRVCHVAASTCGVDLALQG
jgi:hypothetical protein